MTDRRYCYQILATVLNGSTERVEFPLNSFSIFIISNFPANSYLLLSLFCCTKFYRPLIPFVDALTSQNSLFSFAHHHLPLGKSLSNSTYLLFKFYLNDTFISFLKKSRLSFQESRFLTNPFRSVKFAVGINSLALLGQKFIRQLP